MKNIARFILAFPAAIIGWVLAALLFNIAMALVNGTGSATQFDLSGHYFTLSGIAFSGSLGYFLLGTFVAPEAYKKLVFYILAGILLCFITLIVIKIEYTFLDIAVYVLSMLPSIFIAYSFLNEQLGSDNN